MGIVSVIASFIVLFLVIRWKRIARKYKEVYNTYLKLNAWRALRFKKSVSALARTREPELEYRYSKEGIPNLKIFAMDGEDAAFVEREGGGVLYINLGWVGVIMVSSRMFEGKEELLSIILLHEEGHHINRDRRYRGWIDLLRKENRADRHAILNAKDGKEAARMLLSHITSVHQGWKRAWMVITQMPRMVHLLYRMYAG